MKSKDWEKLTIEEKIDYGNNYKPNPTTLLRIMWVGVIFVLVNIIHYITAVLMFIGIKEKFNTLEVTVSTFATTNAMIKILTVTYVIYLMIESFYSLHTTYIFYKWKKSLNLGDREKEFIEDE